MAIWPIPPTNAPPSPEPGARDAWDDLAAREYDAAPAAPIDIQGLGRPEPVISAAELIELLRKLPPDTPIGCMNGVAEEEPCTGLGVEERDGRMIAFVTWAGRPPWRIKAQGEI